MPALPGAPESAAAPEWKIIMARDKQQRMAKIRSFCTTESHQQSLAAVRGGGTWRPLTISAELNDASGWDIRMGGDGLLRTCPECDADTFVDTRHEVMPKSLGPGDAWFCFTCLFTAADRELDDCQFCGQPTTGTELSVCGRCVSEWKS
ncbi:hypothetical protein ACIRST_38295 [Kitasatospora sp. NPDC101447]|uniref:hypothetical protein n=1 Tax=Kitasatospora sp. NPDC101447 TaxID=3364102 RepID=UPI0037F51AF5